MTSPELADQFVSQNMMLSVKALYFGSVPLIGVLVWIVKTLYATTIQLSFLNSSHEELKADHKQLKFDTTNHVSDSAKSLKEIKELLSPLVQKSAS